MKKIKKPVFGKEFYSSTIGTYLMCQEKLKNTNIWKIQRMWKRFNEKDDLKHSEKYKDFIHWINVYFDIPENDVPIVAVYSETTENIIHCLFYKDFLIPASDFPTATLLHPSRVWDLKGNEICVYKWYDWKGHEHSSEDNSEEEESNNVSEEERAGRVDTELER